MRSKLIITGAIGVLAAATLTVNAQTSAHKTTGSVATRLTASAQVLKADRDELTIATRVTATAAPQALKPAAVESEKAEVAKPKSNLPAGCQTAIAALKSLHDADVAEDASERTAALTESPTALAADRTEDAVEAQKWTSALMASRAACLPRTATACQAAIGGLLPVLENLRTDELSEQLGSETDSASDIAAVRTAFSVVATACLRSE